MPAVRGIPCLPYATTYDEMNSPVGVLTIITSPAGLHAVLWEKDCKNEKCDGMLKKLTKSSREKTIIQTKEQLSEYFERKRKVFELPLIMNGTDFQIQVWKQLLKIPYAHTLSYAEQAEKIGSRNKARAVGAANGLNPISIIVPCHRVIGSNGHLTGFGGGIDKKSYLLCLEQS